MSEETPTTESTETTTEGKEDSLSLLASSMFGSNYYGKTEHPESETTETEETQEAEETEASSEESEETETEENEKAEESPEYQEYELSHVAQMLGVDESSLDVDDEGKVVLQGKVDGEPIRANLKDLLSNYQMYQAADKRLEEAKSKREALTKELSEKSEAIEQQYATAAKLIENAEQMLDEESSKIDWKTLREDDPAEYSAKKADMQEKRDRIERMKQEAVQEYQKSKESQNSQSEEAYKEQLAKEQEALIEKLPEWADEKKASAEKAELVKYLQGQDVTGDDLKAIASDHRGIILARKAMLYDKQQANSKAAEKKVAKVPKVMKPGAPKPQEQVNKEKLDQQRAKLRKSGRLEDAFELLRASRS